MIEFLQAFNGRRFQLFIFDAIIKVDFPDGTKDYDMKVLRLKRYTVDELFEKKLYVLHCNVKKGVDDIMGGQLLEFDATKAYHTGEKNGEDKGRTEGENRMGALVNKLVENNMISEITKVTNDPVYRNEMYKKFGI